MSPSTTHRNDREVKKRTSATASWVRRFGRNP
jgi:hypothetical protein